MKTTLLNLFRNVRKHLQTHRRWVMVLALSVFLIPSTARAAGLGDIISLLKTITSTIQGAIGDALSGIENLNTVLNHFRQQIIWPLNAINRARSFVTSTRAQYGPLMFTIENTRNNSATLAPPSQLESLFRGDNRDI